MLRVGLISDTHGLLRPQAVAALQGCDRIVHGGDVGSAAILEALAAIAPLTAVRGNNDREAWADGIPETAELDVAGVRIHVIHDLSLIERHLAGIHVVVSGHSHKPKVETRDGILYVNPGSAGPRRFKLPVSVAELTIEGASVSARIVELAV